MKICVVCDVLGPENNGTTIAAMNLIRSLKKKGHEVRVICPDDDLYRGKEGFYMLKTFSMGKLVNDIIRKNNVTIGLADEKVFAEAMDGVDIVHIMFPMFVGPKAAVYAKEVKHLPLTCGFHCQAENLTSHFFNFMDSKIINNIVYKNYFKKMYTYADCIHYPTQFIRDVFEDVVGPTKGRVISNGVQNSFKPEEVKKPEELKDRKVILFTGRIAKEKSHKVLIRAVHLSKYEKDIQLIFAGQGPRERSIRSLSQKLLTNQPIIKFFSHEELCKVINYADLYVHPAEIEIEAISCLEAISCGKVPVIACSPRCATKAFALDDRSLFKVNDAKDLAMKIDYWFDHPEEKKQMEELYSQSASKFDFDSCMDQMEKMLLDTIQECKNKEFTSDKTEADTEQK